MKNEQGAIVQRVMRRGEWWQAGPKRRWKESAIEPQGFSQVTKRPDETSKLIEVATETDGAVTDGLMTTVTSMNEAGKRVGIGKGAALQVAQDRQATFINVWSRTCFQVRDSPRQSLLDVLDDPGCSKTVERASLNELPCLLATCECAGRRRIQAWLSVRHGLLVRRMLVGIGKGKFSEKSTLIEYEADSFQEHAPGLFFPTHTVMRIYNRGDKPERPTGAVTEAFFEQVKINDPIPDEIFRLTIPEGTRTADWRNGTTFVMGSDGKPSPEYPIHPLETLAPVQPANVPQRTGYARWLWLGGIALAAMIGGFVAWRFRLRKKVNPVA